MDYFRGKQTINGKDVISYNQNLCNEGNTFSVKIVGDKD
jgi:hypothetical protein